MRYLTLQQLVEFPGVLELAQVASDLHAAEVEPVLLELTMRQGDRSEYSAEEIAAADSAVERIEQAATEADAVIDGYLGRRYKLPLATVPKILATWARALTRYRLHGHRISGETTDPIVRDYKDALRFLALIGEGKFSLGVEDPEAQGSGPGEVRIDMGSKVFGRRHLP